MSDNQEPKPQKINRWLDPQWGMFAAAVLPSVADDVHEMTDAARIEVEAHPRPRNPRGTHRAHDPQGGYNE